MYKTIALVLAAMFVVGGCASIASATIDLDAFRKQIVAVVSNNGEYRIVESKTGKIV